MSKTRLELGPGLWFPLDAVTQPIAIMGVRRSGKSNAAAVVAETMFDHALPWVAIDPKGDWWGLRSSADGGGPGLPIPIFGGLHGDLPLTPEAGALMADLVFEHNLTCVLDVSRFSVAARSRFLVQFGDRLFELHQADPQPRMVFLEEAHRILPQQVRAEMAHCVGTWTKVIAEGGGFGLGVCILDQRCATVNKDGLTQIEAMVALRTTSPQDRKAIRDWMIHHAIADDLTETLPSLASGEAWVSSSYWLPQHGQPAIQRKRFRQRRTYDSGATPVIGQVRKATTLADIDLGALEARMATVTEQAALNDPAALRRHVARLERQLAAAANKITNPQAGAEVARLDAENADLRRQLADALNQPPEQVIVQAVSLEQYAALADLAEAMGKTIGGLQDALSRVNPADPPRMPATKQPPALERGTVAPAHVAAERPPAPQPTARPEPGDTRIGKAARTILAVLAQYPAGRSKIQLSLLSGYSVKSSGYANALGALRSAGYVNRGNPIQITAEGREMLGDDWQPLPTGEALIRHWMSQLGRAERTILDHLLDIYPGTATRDELAVATGYSAASSGFANALGKLRSLELINRGAAISAEPAFADEVLTHD